LSDFKLGFKVTVYLQVEYVKTVRFRDKVTKVTKEHYHFRKYSPILFYTRDA